MSRSLRILHCLRAPVGGLFRHVCDLARAQALDGHKIGIVCDSSTGGERADKALDSLAHDCSLGISRVPMSRQIGPKDFPSYFATVRFAQDSEADVIHGHGAKGGAFARLAGRRLRQKGKDLVTLYTPHGGSLHYGPETVKGKIFHTLERQLELMSDGIIFESQYSSSVYARILGEPRCAMRVIPNGLTDADFQRAVAEEDAADFVFVGELRKLKGVHILIEALGRLNKTKDVRAVIVGGGPDEALFKQQSISLGLSDIVRFPGVMPAAEAFKLGRCLVVPSLAESFPYIVLEAGAAGIPLIVTDVGGIPEIVGDARSALVTPGAVDPLFDRMSAFLEEPDAFGHAADTLRERVEQKFSVAGMSRAVLEFYDDVAQAQRLPVAC